MSSPTIVESAFQSTTFIISKLSTYQYDGSTYFEQQANQIGIPTSTLNFIFGIFLNFLANIFYVHVLHPYNNKNIINYVYICVSQFMIGYFVFGWHSVAMFGLACFVFPVFRTCLWVADRFSANWQRRLEKRKVKSGQQAEHPRDGNNNNNNFEESITSLLRQTSTSVTQYLSTYSKYQLINRFTHALTAGLLFLVTLTFYNKDSGRDMARDMHYSYVMARLIQKITTYFYSLADKYVDVEDLDDRYHKVRKQERINRGDYKMTFMNYFAFVCLNLLGGDLIFYNQFRSLDYVQYQDSCVDLIQKFEDEKRAKEAMTTSHFGANSSGIFESPRKRSSTIVRNDQSTSINNESEATNNEIIPLKKKNKKIKPMYKLFFLNLIKAAIFAFITQKITTAYPSHKLQDPKFLETNSIFQILSYIMISVYGGHRCALYTIWSLLKCNAYLLGIETNKDDAVKVCFATDLIQSYLSKLRKKISIINVMGVCFSTTGDPFLFLFLLFLYFIIDNYEIQIMNNWNLLVTKWLKLICFERINKNKAKRRILLTFVISLVWHGVGANSVCTFALCSIGSIVTRKWKKSSIYKNINNFLTNKYNQGNRFNRGYFYFYKFLGWAWTQFTISYITVCYGMTSFDGIFRLYKKTNFGPLVPMVLGLAL